MKILKLTISILIACIAIFGLQNCKKEHYPEAPVCFQEEVLPIMVSNCTQSGCHNSFDKTKGLDLSNYEGILRGVKKGNYHSSELYTVLVNEFGDIMPPKPYSPLSDEQIKTIARWIDEGAKDIQGCGPACDTTQANFAANVFPIIETFCNGCHGTKPPQGGISLATYADIKPFVNNGSLLGSIKFESGYSPMPKNGSKISQCKIDIIEKWIKDGAQNN
ncbi:MAG: hypothetical protein JNK41_07020 [Saprospiraceae bacterium]|jgi:uncharacterized membrane protein|nr:hypothetical protein [Saprospiraceae bacterium]